MTPPTFGIWHDFRQVLPWSLDWATFYRECLDEVVAAERLGFAQVWLTENHFVDDGYLSAPMVVAGAIAARTERILIGTNVVVLPLHHPLRVAEDAAAVDLLSGGRFILGVGVGYVQNEFETFGVDRTLRPSLLEEGIAVMRQAWHEGRTGFSGKRWSFADLPFAPRPARRIPIYIGGAAPAAIDRAARLADGFLASRNVATAGNAGYVESYRLLQEALARHGRDPASVAFVVGCHVYVNEDPERAWADVAPGLAYQINQYLRWGTDRDQPKPLPVAMETLNPENYFVGTPEQVAARLIALHRDAPYDQLCFWARLPGLRHEQTLASMRLFAQDVIPLVLAGVGANG